MNETAGQNCTWCDKPIFATIKTQHGQASICADHYIQMQGVENERQRQLNDAQRQNMAMLNMASAHMDQLTGFSHGPAVVIPPPAPAATYSSIAVRDSTVGVVSTAAVGQISVSIGAIHDSASLAEALKAFTASVVEDQGLSEDLRRDLLDQLSVVAAEAAAKPEERRKGVVNALLAGIGQAANAATTVATAWRALEPILKGHFGL